MDNIQNEVNDYLESPNDKVIKRAKIATENIIKERYPNGYSQEVYDKIMQEQIVIARQQILEEMKFEQEYKQIRHIGDIEEEKRHLDQYKANLEDEKLFQQGEISQKIYRAEGEIVQDEIQSDLNVHSIVDHYRILAERYNISDENAVHHIIEEAIQNPEQLLNVQAMGSLISDSTKKEEFKKMVEEHEGRINIQDLLNQLADMRIKTSEGYLKDVASADISARADGIKQKTDTLKHFRDNSIVQEDYYEQEIARLNSRKNEISHDKANRIDTENEVASRLEQLKTVKESLVKTLDSKKKTYERIQTEEKGNDTYEKTE